MRFKQFILIVFIISLLSSMVFAATDVNLNPLQNIPDTHTVDKTEPSLTTSDIQFPEVEKQLSEVKDSIGKESAPSTGITTPLPANTNSLALNTSKSSSIFSDGNPLNILFDAMGGLFDFEYIRQKPWLFQGIIRCLLFFLFFVVSRRIFMFEKENKPFFDNKTASIIAGIFAAIATLMMPTSWVLLNGGIITLIFGSLIPIGLCAGAIYLSLGPLNKNTAGRIVGIALLIGVLGLIATYKGLLFGAFFFVSPKIKEWLRK